MGWATDVLGTALQPPTVEGEFSATPAAEAFGATEETPLQAMGAGVRMGIDQSQALGYGLASMVSKSIGLEKLSESAWKGYESNMAEAAQNAPLVNSITEINSLDDAVDWAFGAFGQALPSLAGAAVSGGVGALATKSLVKGTLTNAFARQAMMKEIGEQAVKDLSRRGLKKEMAKEYVEKALTSNRGQIDKLTSRWMRQHGLKAGLAGGYAYSGPMGVGEVYGELREQGIEAPGTAIGIGAISGALDIAPEAAMASRLVKKALAKEVKKDVSKKASDSMLKTIGINVAKQMPAEGVTEGAQEYLQLVARAIEDPSYTIGQREDWMRVLDAAAAGAVVGAFVGGGGGVIDWALNQRQNDDEVTDKPGKKVPEQQPAPAPAAAPAASAGPAVAAQQPVEAGANAAPVQAQVADTPTQEAPEDLAAQAERAASQTVDTKKTAVLFPKGNEAEYEAALAQHGGQTIELPQGQLLFPAGQEVAYEAAQEALRMGADPQAVIGNNTRWSEGEDTTKPSTPTDTAFQRRDAQGRVIAAAAVTPGNEEQAYKTLADGAPATDVIEQTTPQEIVAARPDAQQEPLPSQILSAASKGEWVPQINGEQATQEASAVQEAPAPVATALRSDINTKMSAWKKKKSGEWYSASAAEKLGREQLSDDELSLLMEETQTDSPTAAIRVAFDELRGERISPLFIQQQIDQLRPEDTTKLRMVKRMIAESGRPELEQRLTEHFQNLEKSDSKAFGYEEQDGGEHAVIADALARAIADYEQKNAREFAPVEEAYDEQVQAEKAGDETTETQQDMSLVEPRIGKPEYIGKSTDKDTGQPVYFTSRLEAEAHARMLREDNFNILQENPGDAASFRVQAMDDSGKQFAVVKTPDTSIAAAYNAKTGQVESVFSMAASWLETGKKRVQSMGRDKERVRQNSIDLVYEETIGEAATREEAEMLAKYGADKRRKEPPVITEKDGKFLVQQTKTISVRPREIAKIGAMTGEYGPTANAQMLPGGETVRRTDTHDYMDRGTQLHDQLLAGISFLTTTPGWNFRLGDRHKGPKLFDDDLIIEEHWDVAQNGTKVKTPITWGSLTEGGMTGQGRLLEENARKQQLARDAFAKGKATPKDIAEVLKRGAAERLGGDPKDTVAPHLWSPLFNTRLQAQNWALQRERALAKPKDIDDLAFEFQSFKLTNIGGKWQARIQFGPKLNKEGKPYRQDEDVGGEDSREKKLFSGEQEQSPKEARRERDKHDQQVQLEQWKQDERDAATAVSAPNGGFLGHVRMHVESPVGPQQQVPKAAGKQRKIPKDAGAAKVAAQALKNRVAEESTKGAIFNEIARGVMKLLSLPVDLNIGDSHTKLTTAVKDLLGVDAAAQFRRETAELREQKREGYIWMSGKQMFIYVDPSLSVNAQIKVLAHELGHAVTEHWWNTLDDVLKRKLMDAHAKAGQEKQFEEWLANQFVKWANSKARQPTNLMERALYKAAQMFKKMWDYLRGMGIRRGYKLDQTFDQFMNAVAGLSRSVDRPLAGKRAITLDPFAMYFRSFGNVSSGKWAGLPKAKVTVIPKARHAIKDGVVTEGFATYEEAKKEMLPLYRKHPDAAIMFNSATGMIEVHEPVGDSKLFGMEAPREADGKPLTDWVIGNGRKMNNALRDKSRAYDYGLSWLSRMASQLFAPVHARLKQMDRPEAATLRKIFSLDPTEKATVQRYNPDTQKFYDEEIAGNFYFDRERDIHRYSEEAADLATEVYKIKSWQQDLAISSWDPDAFLQTETGKLLAPFFERLRAYMLENGLKLGEVKGYYPINFDREMVKQEGEAFFKALWEPSMQAVKERYAKHGQELSKDDLEQTTREHIDNLWHAIVNESEQLPQATDTQDVRSNYLKKTDFAAVTKHRTMTTDERRALAQAGFIVTEPMETLTRYARQVVNSSLFNKYLGDTTWTAEGREEPTYGKRLIEMGERIERSPRLSDQEKQFFWNSVDALLGRYKFIEDEKVRAANDSLLLFQSTRTLMFTVLASLPDMSVLHMRAGDTGMWWKGMRRDLGEALQGHGAAWDSARALGIIHETVEAHLLSDMTQYTQPGLIKKLNGAFWKYTGIERWSNAMRACAVALGKDYIIKHAAQMDSDRMSKVYMDELGINAKDVERWKQAGYPIYGQGGYSIEALMVRSKGVVNSAEMETMKSIERISGALSRFANEATITANPAEKTLWGNNPYFKVLWHLKSYMYGYWQRVLKRAYWELQQRGLAGVAPIYLPALGMAMVLAAFGMELRDLLQYKLWGRKSWMDTMPAHTYAYQAFIRSGFLGPAQLVADVRDASYRGRAPVLAVLGPTMTWGNDLLQYPAYKTIPQSIPLVAQLPFVRDPTRDWIKETFYD